MIGPVLVTVLIGGPIAERAVTSPQPEAVVLAVEVWLFIIVTWIGSLWIGRGTWRPLAETTAAFVDLAVRRCRSNLRAIQFGAVLYLGQLLFVLFWSLRYSSVGLWALLTSWSVVLLGWLGVPAVFGLFFWYTHRKRSELAYLLDVQQQLADDVRSVRL